MTNLIVLWMDERDNTKFRLELIEKKNEEVCLGVYDNVEQVKDIMEELQQPEENYMYFLWIGGEVTNPNIFYSTSKDEGPKYQLLGVYDSEVKVKRAFDALKNIVDEKLASITINKETISKKTLIRDNGFKFEVWRDSLNQEFIQRYGDSPPFECTFITGFLNYEDAVEFCLTRKNN